MKPIERKMPSISYIVARSSPGGLIGCENKLPWRLRTDLKFFKSVTESHVVIMGRKTLESLGRPLPNRINIVLSSNPGRDTEDLIWATSPEMAIFIADYLSILRDKSEIIVIGGAQIYKVYSEQFTRIYLTEVLHDFGDGDAYFTESFDLREWKVLQKKEYPASDHDEFDFVITVLEKRRIYTRHRDIQEFYVNGELDRLKSDFGKFTDKLSRPAVESSQISLPLLVA